DAMIVAPQLVIVSERRSRESNDPDWRSHSIHGGARSPSPAISQTRSTGRLAPARLTYSFFLMTKS
ncbi:MAG TPA: hypothetical protein VKL99_02390, partial [Candidatus Angelobacter sp.]|nr:hypothetical protein [Candidatus Angelobacter sp.]